MPKISEHFFIIGHRGAAGEYFENSLEAIKHALKLDIDAIEIDVREHAAELWVIHDHDLNRLTGTAGLFEDQTDIARLRLGNGEPIPSLQQVLDLTWGRKALNIEIKAIDDPERLLRLLARYPTALEADGLPAIIISSFNHRLLARLRQLGCPWALAPICSGVPLQVAAETGQITPYSWHFDDEYLDLALVRELRKRDIPSLVYTVNDLGRAEFLRQQGVAGIFTDYPSKMIEIY